MKNYVEKVPEPQPYQVCVSRSCDLCGKTTNGDDWDKRNYNVNETEISITIKHRRGAVGAAMVDLATNMTLTFAPSVSAIAWYRG